MMMDYYGTQWTYTTCGGFIFMDEITHTSYQIDAIPYGTTEMNRYALDMALQPRLRVIDFFRRLTRETIFGEMPPILLFGSAAPRIVDAISRLADYTRQEPLPPLHGSINEYDDSIHWLRANTGKKFSEYKMRADLSGWRVFREYQHGIITEGLQLLGRVDWARLGVDLWG